MDEFRTHDGHGNPDNDRKIFGLSPIHAGIFAVDQCFGAIQGSLDHVRHKGHAALTDLLKAEFHRLFSVHAPPASSAPVTPTPSLPSTGSKSNGPINGSTEKPRNAEILQSADNISGFAAFLHPAAGHDQHKHTHTHDQG